MTQPRFNLRPMARRSGGFTLVELLVTIAIIAILASIAMVAVASARKTAKVAKTKATITKLHNLVTRQYDSYLTRRVSVALASGNFSSLPPTLQAQIRLRALRELMRMEMPDRLTDVTNPGSTDPDSDPPASSDEPLPLDFQVEVPNNLIGAVGAQVLTARVYRSTLAKAYFRRYIQNPPSGTYSSAELLYLTVSYLGREARSQFNDTEVGDADHDGWPEFRDAWGNPIYFLRWAPAFNDSRIQADVVPLSAIGPSIAPDDLWDNVSDVQTAKQNAAAVDHDPFDTRGVHVVAWRLVPLIVSAGPDGIYDISFAVKDKGDPTKNYYFGGDPYARFIGLPCDVDNTSVTATGPQNGRMDHYDNIHNHRLQD